MEDVVNYLCNELKLEKKQVTNVIKLLEDGATIPFIARYRKEATGNLDENELRDLESKYKYFNNLKAKKEEVTRLIDEQGKLTNEIIESINKASKLVDLEDIYRPFRPKKETKAEKAIKEGYDVIAKKMLAFPLNGDIDGLVKPFKKEEALEKAGYIIASWISDYSWIRKYLRIYYFKNADIITKIKKEENDPKKTYQMYYNFNMKVKYLKDYHILAINRGEREEVLKVSFNYDYDEIYFYIEDRIIKNKNSFVVPYIKDYLNEALKKSIIPSIETDIRNSLTEEAEEKSLITFKNNLKHLLLQRPLKSSIILGFDPAFRTGCKLAIIDETGSLLDIEVIYPHEPQNKWDEAKNKIKELINKYHINYIACGNGTASRESEKLIQEIVKDMDVSYAIVSEAGASVYSASKVAQEEFPELTLEKRSAISIARRLQDPLAELVKIPPEAIGVGEYQHDIKESLLKENLANTVTDVVSDVGCNINTASPSLLSHIDGLTKATISKIIAKRPFKSREELKKIIPSKAYEQTIGFLKVYGDNKLDKTRIHPESYPLANQLLDMYSLDNIKDLDINKVSNNLNTDIYTLRDIIDELLHPGLDPRDKAQGPVLKKDVLDIKDLKVGMELEGTVRNVATFGAFVDIGLHEDGLIHISHISKNYVKDINDYLKVGDIIKVNILDIDKERLRVDLELVSKL